MAGVIEALKFLLAMVALALVVYVLGWLLIVAGGWLLQTVHHALRALGLPFPVALTGAIFAVAFLVGAIEHRLTRSRKPRIRA